MRRRCLRAAGQTWVSAVMMLATAPCFVHFVGSFWMLLVPFGIASSIQVPLSRDMAKGHLKPLPVRQYALLLPLFASANIL